MMILILPIHSGSFIHGVHCGGFFFSPQFGYRLHQRGYVLTRVRLFAGWSDLQQDYTEAAEEIPNKH